MPPAAAADCRSPPCPWQAGVRPAPALSSAQSGSDPGTAATRHPESAAYCHPLRCPGSEAAPAHCCWARRPTHSPSLCDRSCSSRNRPAAAAAAHERPPARIRLWAAHRLRVPSAAPGFSAASPDRYPCAGAASKEQHTPVQNRPWGTPPDSSGAQSQCPHSICNSADACESDISSTGCCRRSSAQSQRHHTGPDTPAPARPAARSAPLPVLRKFWYTPLCLPRTI